MAQAGKADQGAERLPADWREANRHMWDERVPIHVAGPFYDVESFRRGDSTLRPFELEEMGPVAGRELVHLQCHFGLDTLSWARQGARVTGLDFSGPAIAAARALAAELGIEADFVEADVLDAPARLGRCYDIVYTGLGALCWLPDIEAWAEVAAGLVRPGGRLYLAEFHPFTDIFDEQDLSVRYPYFDGGAPYVDESGGSYADLGASTAHNRSYCWTHPVSRVIDALLRRGLRLERFSEHDHTLFPRWPWLRRSGRDRYELPPELPALPLMYSARFGRDR